jgi:hypothetical protein
MKTARVLLLLTLLLPLPAFAAEEPEAVYARYHRGLASGNLEDVLRSAAEQLRSEIAGLAPDQRAAVMKNLAALAPSSYTLRGKKIEADDENARLVVSGDRQAAGTRKPETLYGSIRMVRQRGEWRVAASEWSPYEPEALGPAPAAAPAAAAGVPKAAIKTAPPPKGSPPVIGSMDGGPERKLGKAKEPCVFKPVMTAEDMEKCR